jgi:hypothetical protein
MARITTMELAAELGLGASTVRAIAAAGKIPFTTTPGGHRRYDLDEVRRALGLAKPPPTLGEIRAFRDRIRPICRRHGARRPRIVGSVARGEQRPGSDVDLLVDLDEGRTLFDVAALHDELEDLLGHPVDVITSGALRDGLEGLIEDAVAL